VCDHHIAGDFTMDCYCTSAEVLNHIHGKKDRFGRPRGYVGDLKTNRAPVTTADVNERPAQSSP